jgi:hypothetical protein
MTALVATGRPGGVATVLVALLPVVFGGSLRLRHGLVNYCGYERWYLVRKRVEGVVIILLFLWTGGQK